MEPEEPVQPQVAREREPWVRRLWVRRLRWRVWRFLDSLFAPRTPLAAARVYSKLARAAVKAAGGRRAAAIAGPRSDREIELAVEWARLEGLHPIIFVDRGTYLRLSCARELRRQGILHAVPFGCDDVTVAACAAEALDAPLIVDYETYLFLWRLRPYLRERLRFYIVGEKLTVK